jgi:WD40 repeat protein
VLTCTTPECQMAISYCIDSAKCFGTVHCKRCLNNYPGCNSACANDLFNEVDYLSVNGFKHLPCDDTSAEQVKACELHCRGFYFRYSECTLLDGFPICKCSSVPISFSSTSSTSTSNLSTSTNTVMPSTTIKTTTTTSVPTTSFWSSLTLNGHTNDINAVVALKNGDLASADDDRRIIIWDSMTYQIKRNLTGHSNWILCLAVLLNGELASGSRDSSIKVWDLVSGTLKRTLIGHYSYVYSLAVLNSGDLASASRDYTVNIWNAYTGILLRTLTGHTSFVFSLAVLSNDYLASGDSLGRIRIWEVSTGAFIKQLNQSSFVWAMKALENGDLVSSD